MPHSSSRTGSRPHKTLLTQRLLLALLLVTLLLIWPTASRGEESVASAAPDSVLVPRTLLIGARETIDELEAEVAFQDSLLVAQREYYIELLALKDQHIKVLEETVDDALGSDAKDLLEKLIWGLAGYGLHAAGTQ